MNYKLLVKSSVLNNNIKIEDFKSFIKPIDEINTKLQETSDIE